MQTNWKTKEEAAKVKQDRDRSQLEERLQFMPLSLTFMGGVAQSHSPTLSHILENEESPRKAPLPSHQAHQMTFGNSLRLQTNKVEFTSLDVGKADEQIISLVNDGHQTIYWIFLEDPSRAKEQSAFVVSPPSGQLSARAVKEISVVFRPRKNGQETRSLTLLESPSHQVLSLETSQLPSNTHKTRPQLELLGVGQSPQGALARKQRRTTPTKGLFYSQTHTLAFQPTLVGLSRVDKVRFCNASQKDLQTSVDSLSGPFVVERQVSERPAPFFSLYVHETLAASLSTRISA